MTGVIEYIYTQILAFMHAYDKQHISKQYKNQVVILSEDLMTPVNT